MAASPLGLLDVRLPILRKRERERRRGTFRGREGQSAGWADYVEEHVPFRPVWVVVIHTGVLTVHWETMFGLIETKYITLQQLPAIIWFLILIMQMGTFKMLD